MDKKRVTYLDNNSTTQVDQRIIDTMLPFFKDNYSNASSNYLFSGDSNKAINRAKESVSQYLNCEPSEIVFTSGATESLNFALKGLAFTPNNKKKHIITCSTEHKAVLETCRYLESVGFIVDYLPVNNDGSLDLELLKSSISADTLLVCLMWVNNETGVIHPIKEIGEIAKEAGIYFVCDGTQGVGKLSIDAVTCGIDILCFSGHKMYAPKGIGGLFINNSLIKNNKLQPLIHGGGQENNLRSGTYNVPLIAAIGKAFEIAQREMEDNRKQIEQLRNNLEIELLKINGAYINGKTTERIYNTVNICIPGFDTEVFMGISKDIAVSNGSACNAALIQPSHVLLAMGLSNDDAMCSMRISLGKENTYDDISIIIKKVHNFIHIKS